MMTQTLPTVTREFLANLNWKPFDKSMWYGFAGCTSPVPFYAEQDDVLYILDGVTLCIYFGNQENDDYEMIQDVTAFPYQA